MKQWVDWKKDTIKLLETSYKELYNIDELCAAIEIKKLLSNVEEELKYAQHKYLTLEAIGYDMVSIVEEQDYYYKKYNKK